MSRQVEALLRQTRPLQEIIVVDDGSTDDTCESLTRHFPQVTLLRTGKKLGAAGAWALGLAYAALEKKYDWIWTLDDDSFPDERYVQSVFDALELLSNECEKVGIVAGLPTHQETQTRYTPLLWREGFVRPSSEVMQQPIWFADLVFASGSMVRGRVIEAIGLPRSEFFMDFADFDLCLRARARGYRIAVASNAKLSHIVGRARTVRLAGYSSLWPDYDPWREYYVSRNLVYAAWWLYPTARTKQFAVRHLARHAGGVVLFGSNKFASLKRMAQGFADGLRARLGIRFLPGTQQHA